MTPGGSAPAGAGAGRLVFARRLQPLSRADKAPTSSGVPFCRTGAQKPDEANDIYRPVTASALIFLLEVRIKDHLYNSYLSLVSFWSGVYHLQAGLDNLLQLSWILLSHVVRTQFWCKDA